MTLAFPLQAQAQVANGWNLYRAQNPDGSPQFSLGYHDPVENRFILTFGCTPHRDEVTVIYSAPPGTVADTQDHEVWLASENNSDGDVRLTSVERFSATSP